MVGWDVVGWDEMRSWHCGQREHILVSSEWVWTLLVMPWGWFERPAWSEQVCEASLGAHRGVKYPLEHTGVLSRGV